MWTRFSTCFNKFTLRNQSCMTCKLLSIGTISAKACKLEISNSGSQTKSSQLLDIPPVKTTTGQRSFYYQAVKLWNDLGDRLKFCKKCQHFQG